MKKKSIIRFFFSILMIVSTVTSLQAAEYIFEVPVNIESFDFSVPGGMVSTSTSFRVTCAVFDGRRQIGSSNKTQRFSESYRGNLEVRINVSDAAGKAERYTCKLELCTSASGFGMATNCVDPRASAPRGSVTEVSGAIAR